MKTLPKSNKTKRDTKVIIDYIKSQILYFYLFLFVITNKNLVSFRNFFYLLIHFSFRVFCYQKLLTSFFWLLFTL
jgi:hypothetical protein